jgi:diaminopimelate epimerase
VTGARAFKLSGAGNDFIAFAEPAQDPTADQILLWCRRRESVGADGVFALCRDGAARVRMTYWNADGGSAALCFNGARCAAQLAFHLGWARDAVVVATAAGSFRAELVDRETVRIEAPAPEERPRALELEVGDTKVSAWWLRVGVPHLVIEHSELERLDVRAASPPLRGHPALGTEGANVNFVDFAARHRLSVRTYERGVEDEVLACGSGVLAAAALGLERGLLALPIEVATRGGLPLRLEPPLGERHPWSLCGDARLVANLELHAGALLGTCSRDSIDTGRR